MKTTYEHFVFEEAHPWLPDTMKITCLVRHCIDKITDIPHEDELWVMGFCFGGEYREKFLQWWNRKI